MMHPARSLFGCTLFALTMVLTIDAAGAREVYKYRMPDGRILYSSEVMTQGKLLEVLPPPPASPQLIESEQRARLQRERAQERAVSKRLDSMDAVEAEIKSATLALEAAKAAAAAGVEPLPGEHLGLAKKPTGAAIKPGDAVIIPGGATLEPGRTRLNDDYWGRQRQLGLALDAARVRLDTAYLARDALR